MSYTCKDDGPDAVCNGCGKHPNGSRNSSSEEKPIVNRIRSGMNRAQRREQDRKERRMGRG